MNDDVKQASTDRYAVSQAYRWRAERDKAMQELRQLKKEVDGRLVPEGMTWPCFTDGAPIEIGCTVIGPDFGEVIEVDAIKFHANGFTLCDKGGFEKWYEDDDTFERPAPKVLDADGVEIELGDDLYSIEGMLKFHVSAIDKKSGRIATEAMFALDKWADPKMLTHRAPVLAADGKPLREGETVWHAGNGIELTVIGLPRSVEYHAVKLRLDDGAVTGLDPDQLTHQHPESWERLEEDATLSVNAYRKLEKPDGMTWPQAVRADLVRRARKMPGEA